MKKLLTLIVALALLLCSLSGCSSSPLDPDKPVTLTMWHNYGGDMQEAMDYLIDQFNSTVGKDKGIIINVTAISSSSELNKSLEMIVNDDPGALDMPDIFTGYPKLAIQFREKDMLVNLNEYFSDTELSHYVDAFLEEGRLDDGGLYVFPMAKSTEIMYLNQTLFDRFAAATGAQVEQLYTFEGIASLSQQYYQWTDDQTPDIPDDGKQFYTADSWFNLAEIGMEQLGSSIFENGEALSLEKERFNYIFDTIYTPAVKGGVAIYDGYSSDLSKTGDLVCSTGSSAGILFYGNTITLGDGTVENVEYNILPYPVFKDGEKVALQRGGGLMVAKSNQQKEYAACEFIKWLTAAEQNMKFISKTGYLPVTKEAFEDEMPAHIENLDDERIKKMLTAVMSMYDEYRFFTAPTYSSFDDDSESYEHDFKEIMKDYRNKFLKGENVSSQAALTELKG